MIYTLTLNPAIDRTLFVDELNYKDVTRVNYVTREAAGKGINVSKVIKAMNKQSKCVGFAGGHNGEFISDELTKLEISNLMIQVDGNTRENIKVISSKEGNMMELNESGTDINDDQLKKMYLYFDEYLEEEDILILSGSVPKNIQNTIYYDIISRYKERGIKTILDTSKQLFEEGIKASPTIIKPNIYELQQYFNTKIESEKEMIHYALECVKKGIKEVLVTMGKEGSLYVSNTEIYKVNIPTIEAKGTVGAGDSYVAGYAIALQENLSIEDKLKYASAVSIASCMQPGSAPGDLNDVENIIKEITIKKINEV